MAIMLRRVLRWVETLGAVAVKDELSYWLTNQARSAATPGHPAAGGRRGSDEQGTDEDLGTVFARTDALDPRRR